MTQEEAMNMSNEQAVQILIPMRNMMCDQNGCPISDAVFALDKAIESLSADVAPVRHAKWIGTEFDGYADGFPVYDVYECSECGMEYDSTDYGEITHNYCPNCGAKMDEGEEVKE